jgi:hypothetical protein
MAFKAGQQSANPNGRSRGVRSIRKLAADRAFQAVAVLGDILESHEVDAYSKVIAAQAILNLAASAGAVMVKPEKS